MIKLEWFLTEEQAPIKNKTEKLYNTKTFKQIARQNNKLNHEELDEELA